MPRHRPPPTTAMTRSLLRVLLSLVLLSAFAFRGVGFDSGGAPTFVPLRWAPPRLALQGAAGLPWVDGPARSTKVVALAAPKQKKARDFLILPRTRRGDRLRAATSYSDALPRSKIRINNNGTIQLVDDLSNSPLWEVCTGPPPSNDVTTRGPDTRYLIYPMGGESTELLEFYNGTSVILPWKLEDFITRTPFIRDSFVTIGSKASTIFIIDGCSGKVLYKYFIPSILSKSEGLWVEGMQCKPTVVTDDSCGNIVMVVRSDYSLSASDIAEHMFHWTRSYFTAKYRILDHSSHLLGDIPCIRNANATPFRDSIPPAHRDGDDSLRLNETSRKLPQSDGNVSGFISSDSEAIKKVFKMVYGWLIPMLTALLVIGYHLIDLIRTLSSRLYKKIVDISGRPEGKENAKSKQQKGGGADKHKLLVESVKDNGEVDAEAEETDVEYVRTVGKLSISNNEIGRGSNGTVIFEGSYDERRVAVKRLLRSHYGIASEEKQSLILSDQHPNIVRLYGYEEDSDFVYIALERCTCSLFDLIEKHSDAKGLGVVLWTQDGSPSPQLLKLIRDVVSGLVHLHSLGIVHRDLKPQNVLINTEECITAKLSDMGISKRLQKGITSVSHHGSGIGTSGWQAPEQLNGGRQSHAMDVFSLGCLIFYCITEGKHPFGGQHEQDQKILKNDFDLFLVQDIPEAEHLVTQLLKEEPEDRPSAMYVMHHPLFWTPELSLSFLKDTSDRIKGTSDANLIKAIEGIKSDVFRHQRNWKKNLHHLLIQEIGSSNQYYDFKSVCHLLRYIRNKSTHYNELPNTHKAIFGCLPEGFYWYFRTRFPKLLMEVYKVMWVHCNHEDAFSKYFK